MKRNITLLTISLLLFITLIPSSIYADTATTTPDVSVYATKQQLMDDTFRPDTNGAARNIGKIIFGKKKNADNTYSPLEWYVLGADIGVNGDNTVILAKTPIIKDKKFYDLSDKNGIVSDGNVKWLIKSSNYKDCIYPKDFEFAVDPQIAINHYGTSDVRAELKEITGSSEKGYFSAEELHMMNSTVITTEDLYNKTSYTTEDRLYLPNRSIDNHDPYMEIGSDNQISILYDNDYKFPYSFWLRSPETVTFDFPNYSYDNVSQYANICLLYFDNDVETDYAHVNTSEKQFNYGDKVETRNIGVVPVGNLNLSNVLFASTAMAGLTGELDVNFGMDLRLDGSDKGLGSATVYSDHIEIKKGSNSNVALIVQGRNGTINWAYSKDIPTDGSVNKVTKTDIISALTALNITDIDLSKCKVWLETTDTSQRMIYAVEAKAVQEINSVEVKIDAPEAGQELATDVSSITEGVNVDSISWNPNDTISGYYKQYIVTLTLSPEPGYRFTDNITLKLNNKDLSPKNTDGTITVTYTFDETAKDVLDSIDNPEFIYENGTPKEEFIFPDTVTITTKGNSSLSVPVTWNKDVLNTYNPLNPDEVMIKLSGTASIPEYIDYTSNKVIMTVTVESKLRIIDGNKQTTNINEGLPAVFKSNAEFKDFVRVEIDDEIIVKDQDYEVKEGSIIITLKPEYLSKLSLGEHKIAIISYKDKNHEEVYEVKAEGTFTIISNKTESGNNGSHTVIIPDTSVK